MVIKNMRGYNMEIGTDKVYCFSCGEMIKAEAEICPKCGVRQKTNPLIQMKNPGIAAIASFFFAGLGQIYNGEIGKGLLLIIVQTVNVFLMFVIIGFFTYPIVWIYGIYDAYTTAEKINVEMIR
jgi:TM2 domain-containing membrane protein YozV